MSLLDKIHREAQNPTVKVPHRSDELAPAFLHSVPSPVVTTGVEETEQSIISLEDELNTIPPVSAKKIGVRLEVDLYDAIRKFCDQHDITVETLLESYFTLCAADNNLTQKVIEEAQRRIKLRVRAGNIRSLLTKTHNLKKSQ